MRSLVSLRLTVLLAIVMIVSWGTVSQAKTRAESNHVEYVIAAGQQGVKSVVKHGESGLVEVTLDCITAGKSLTFVMDVSVPEGKSELSVRKNSGRDVSSWFSLDPSHVNAPGGRVKVRVEVPSGASLETKTVTRIQEIGDPPAPGGHHGVKVFLGCVGQEPSSTPTKTSVPKTPTEVPVKKPVHKKVPVFTKTPHGDIGEPAFVTPVPVVTVTGLPDSGFGPTTSKGFVNFAMGSVSLALVAVVLAILGCLHVRDS